MNSLPASHEKACGGGGPCDERPTAASVVPGVSGGHTRARRGRARRDEPPPTLELTRQGLIDLLAEAGVTYPARATKTVLLRLLTGIDEADIMRHTRHKSVQIMRRYDRTSGLWIRNATTGVSL